MSDHYIQREPKLYTQRQVDAMIAKHKADTDEIEDDLMYAKDALRDVRDWITCSASRSALEAIVKRGLKE